MPVRARFTSALPATVRAFLQRGSTPLFFLLGAGIVIGLAYSPIVTANFQGDDYAHLKYPFFNFPSMIEGRNWRTFLSLVPPYGVVPYFRPVLQLFNLVDYLAWGLNPIGYHLTNLVLHWLTAFLVFVLCQQLTRARFAAVAAGLFFALMPIHVEAVSWFAARADGLNALCFLATVVFFVLFRQHSSGLYLMASIGSFVVALGVKEAAVTVPVLLLAYDVLYRRDVFARVRDWVVPYAGFALAFIGYAGLRLVARGLGDAGSFQLARTFEWDYLSQLYALGITDPFFSDMTNELRWLIFGVVVLLLVLFRDRREVWFGALWAVLTLVPSLLSINATIFDRYLYLPSIGLALVLASILSRPRLKLEGPARAIGVLLVCALSLFYANALYARNQEWSRAAQITQTVEEQTQSMLPDPPADSRLVFVNVPVLVGGRQMQAFGNMLPTALEIRYNNPNLEVLKPTGFPILSDRLDRTYFFEYNRRKLTERIDLVRSLEQRNACVKFTPSVEWNFAQDPQGWEAWNDLSDYKSQAGLLQMRATGDDPYLASPEIAVPAMALGNVQVVMRVRADNPRASGAWYWVVEGQSDFSPVQVAEFPVTADGELRTYNVDLTQNGRLFIDDKIIRLRFDPVDAPSEIALSSITVSTRCADQGTTCICHP